MLMTEKKRITITDDSNPYTIKLPEFGGHRWTLNGLNFTECSACQKKSDDLIDFASKDKKGHIHAYCRTCYDTIFSMASDQVNQTKMKKNEKRKEQIMLQLEEMNRKKAILKEEKKKLKDENKLLSEKKPTESEIITIEPISNGLDNSFALSFREIQQPPDFYISKLVTQIDGTCVHCKNENVPTVFIKGNACRCSLCQTCVHYFFTEIQQTEDELRQEMAALQEKMADVEARLLKAATTAASATTTTFATTTSSVDSATTTTFADSATSTASADA
jgi:hypothetical protein